MNIGIRTWLGQVTTGHGVMVLASTALAATSGTISWESAVPLLVGGVVGLFWPENSAAKSASAALSTDMEALIAAYRTGLSHGTATADTAPSGSVPGVPAPVIPAAGLAALAISAAMLCACTSVTPVQKQGDLAAFSAGLVCVADATGKIVVATSTRDEASVMISNTIMAAGGALATDAACQAAVANGNVALAKP